MGCCGGIGRYLWWPRQGRSRTQRGSLLAPLAEEDEEEEEHEEAAKSSDG